MSPVLEASVVDVVSLGSPVVGVLVVLVVLGSLVSWVVGSLVVEVGVEVGDTVTSLAVGATESAVVSVVVLGSELPLPASPHPAVPASNNNARGHEVNA